jgi:CBS domain-containing protein
MMAAQAKKRAKVKKKAAAKKKTPSRRRPAKQAPKRTAVAIGTGGLVAADIMVRDVLSVQPGTSVDEVSSIFQFHNINGAPVVDEEGILVGIITEDDLIFGRMGFSEEQIRAGRPRSGRSLRAVEHTLRVSEIMTLNPIAVEESTPIEEICRLMWRLKIHRIPVARQGKVAGIVSAIDICRLVAEGTLQPARSRR